ncbi:MAG: PAS domain S-box protein [Bacteroidales bacterium]|nr:PAS domain S-box protein [Bacteroidales bacterium]
MHNGYSDDNAFMCRFIIENSHDVFLIFDHLADCLYANSSFEELFGYTPNDKICFPDLFHADDATMHKEAIENLFWKTIVSCLANSGLS